MGRGYTGLSDKKEGPVDKDEEEKMQFAQDTEKQELPDKVKFPTRESDDFKTAPNTVPATPKVEANSATPDAFHIFLFVNPKSGSRKGKLILEHEFRSIRLALKTGKVGRMSIIDIIDPEIKQEGYRELKYEMSILAKTEKRLIFGIACGDGTILTLLDEAQTKEGIDLTKL